MATYTLTMPERQILISWLFEPDGYLDGAIRVVDGQTARQAFAANPALDVPQWVRDNPQLRIGQSTECAMVWWIWKTSGVNITSRNRPPEAAQWAAVLREWDASIVAAFDRANEAIRNTGSVSLTAENGSVSTMPSGQHLTQQRNLISKVLAVLG